MHLFVYGTLTDSKLVQQLTGKEFVSDSAQLLNFRRFQQPGHYPYVLPCDGERVDGLLLRDLDAASVRALDHYEAEGDLYLRIAAIVMTERGPVSCETYAANPSNIAKLRFM